ncbi:peptidylprolyl isomerase [Brevundimonas poindexterae]|uniref:peptidylprolyl isomerase n=1 Tax=Brevundimonas poindexterae TaxID=74325 RepID=UPI001CFC9D95|nr:peptidylprolyl isomerase [Brevundimonas poindexterae]
MISHFRNFAKSPWAIGLVGLIILSFMVLGGSQADIFASLGPRHVVKAGDRSLSQQEFRVDFDKIAENYREQTGQPVTAEDLVNQNIHIRYLEGKVQELSFQSWAHRVGIRPGKELILQQIRQIPAFFNQITGQFDEESYKTVLQGEGLTPAQLEGNLRNEYAQNHFGASLYAAARVPRIYGAVIANGALERRDGRWFAVTQAMAGSAPAPTDEQLNAFMAENADQLRRPETRIASIVLFDSPPGQAPEISEEAIQERFEFRKDALSIPERRTFSVYPAANAEAAQRISAALKAGENPGVEATPYSETPRSAVPDPAVAEAVFGMSQPGVSGPVQGRVGFAVVQVTGIQPGEAATLDGVREAIVQELQAEAEKGAEFDRVSRYETARNSGKSMEEAVEEVGARILTLPAFNEQGFRADGSQINAPPQIFETAWRLPEGGISDVIDAGQGQYFVLRVDKIRPASMPALDEVRDILVREWTARENSRLLSAKAEELAARVRAGEDIAEVARSVGATLMSREGALQDQETVEAIGQGVAQGLFGQAKGQVFVQPQSQTAFAVGVVDDVRASDPAMVAPIAERVRPRVTQDVVSGMGESAIGWTQARAKASYDVGAARQALGLPEEAPAPAGAQ